MHVNRVHMRLNAFAYQFNGDSHKEFNRVRLN
jgi:hypothetical protein